MGDVSRWIRKFPKVRRCPGRWSSESHRQSQSKLGPRQISHPGVTPHSRSPCSEAGHAEPAATSHFDAALFLHERTEELRHKTRAEKTWQSSCFRQQQSDPRKYRVRYLSAQFQGPTARKDAEDSERNRWTTELANLLRGTQSPMGQEAVEGQALLGPESEVSSASSPGWLCAMSSPTRQLSASSQSTCRSVSKSLATEAPLKVHITRWCSLSPWMVSRHKTVSLTVSCTTSCTRNFWLQLCQGTLQSKCPEYSQP